MTRQQSKQTDKAIRDARAINGLGAEETSGIYVSGERVDGKAEPVDETSRTARSRTRARMGRGRGRGRGR